MVIIREAILRDAAGIARVHVESWRSTYPGLIPDPYLVGMSERAAKIRWHSMLQAQRPGEGTYVAVDPGIGVVGFASYGPQRTRIAGYDGEFFALYLLDEAKGQGAGRRLMGAMADGLLTAGVRSAMLWCLRDNQTRWFYERMGGRRLAERSIQFAGTDLVEIAYGWADLVPLSKQSAGDGVQ